MEQQNKITTAQAVEQLRKALKEDQAYWDGWVANIAMSIYDEYMEKLPNTNTVVKSALLEIFNNGADRFLKLLTAEKTTDNE